MDGRSVAISNLVDITGQTGNKEVAMRIHTSVENPSDTFYTDNNGYQLMKRQTYTKLTLQGNFYPMPTSALVQDTNHRVTLFSGQPLGVASLKQGECILVDFDELQNSDLNTSLEGTSLEAFSTATDFKLDNAHKSYRLSKLASQNSSF